MAGRKHQNKPGTFLKCDQTTFIRAENRIIMSETCRGRFQKAIKINMHGKLNEKKRQLV